MAKKSAILALCLLAFVEANTQFMPTTEGLTDNSSTCFIDPIFNETDIQKISNIQYGSAYNAYTNSTESLLLDVYLPPDSDDRESKPAIVFIHGGAFIFGNKSMSGDMKFLKEFLIRGYAAVSIDYRLTGRYWPAETERATLDAVEDARAAVRFLRKNANDYGLDTDRITVMGDSAGAITSLYIGYAANAQYEGDSGNPGYSSEVQYVLSISGQLKQQAFCSRFLWRWIYGCSVNFPNIDHSKDIGTFAGQPPLFMIHGTSDLIVPYNNGREVFAAAQAANITSQFVRLPWAGHVPYGEIMEPDVLAQIWPAMANALDFSDIPQPANCVPYNGK